MSVSAWRLHAAPITFSWRNGFESCSLESNVTDWQREFERDAFIASRSITLADIAQQLLKEDAGTALIKAALMCWERDFGREAALELAHTALVGVHQQSGSQGKVQN